MDGHGQTAGVRAGLDWLSQYPLKVQRAVVDMSIARLGGTAEGEHSRYDSDPVSFGRKVLGEQYTEDVVRLMEAVRDCPVVLARSANGVGKTHAAARIALWFFLAFPESQVYTAAAPPEANLEKLLWGEIGAVIAKKPDLVGGLGIKHLHISRNPKSFLTGVSIPAAGTDAQREARFSGKHAPNLLFILDEGDAIPDVVYRGIESCMSGGHARLLVLFNPRHESGPLYRLERDGLARVVHLSAFHHPNVVTGQTVFAGAVSREKTRERVARWTRALAPNERPDAECVAVPLDLVDFIPAPPLAPKHAPSPGASLGASPSFTAWRRVENPAFWYMVLGEYPPQGETQLIGLEWINRARSRWDSYVAEFGERTPKGARPVIGIDVAEFGIDANVACIRAGGWVARLEVWRGMDVIQSADRVAELAKAWRAETVMVDATGLGAGVAPSLVRLGVRAEPVKVASTPTLKSELGEFGYLRDQLWWAVREWLRTDIGAMLPPDEALIEELRTPSYAVVNGRVRVSKKDDMRDLLKRSPDRADALALTFAPTQQILTSQGLDECLV